MEIRLLNYFLSVTEELHFTRAAEKLGISQPTLSQQIRLLEDRLDTDLFQRNGATIELTEGGNILLEHVNRIFYELDQATTNLKELKKLDMGELRIGSSGNHLLYSSLKSFYKEYPGIKVSVYDLKTEETIENLRNSTFDIGVVFLPVHHSQIETIPLFTSDLCVVVGESHPLAQRETVYLTELQQYPLFLYPEKYLIREQIIDYCKTQDIRLNPIVELSDTYSLIKMSILSKGVTVLPRLYIETEKNLPYQIVNIADPIPKIEIGIIYRKGRKLSSAIQAFIYHLKDFYVDDNWN